MDSQPSRQGALRRLAVPAQLTEQRSSKLRFGLEGAGPFSNLARSVARSMISRERVRQLEQGDHEVAG